MSAARRILLSASLAVLLAVAPAGAQTVVFETDFESGLPAAFSAPGATLQGVQGYAGLGPSGNTFGGQFLRYDVQGILDTRLVLRNLPPHDHVDLGFLLAVIDSWDGTELFQVSVDGDLRFSHWFQLATGDASSYAAPPGALLSSGVNLGFTNGTYYFRDRAYDLSVEPAFRAIPHTADTLEVKWFLSAVSGGAAAQWQGGGDESWAIDQVKVTTSLGLVGVPGPAASGPALTLGLAGTNPVRSGEGVRVRLTLPHAGEAHLEWFDARGRRLAAREIGGWGPGTHELVLSTEAPAAAGVGFVRLAQGGERRVLRFVRL